MQVAFLKPDTARSEKRPLPDSNRGWQICNPLPYHLAKGPGFGQAGQAPGSLAGVARSPRRVYRLPHPSKLIVFRTAAGRAVKELTRPSSHRNKIS
jgi:hypothetical protein